MTFHRRKPREFGWRERAIHRYVVRFVGNGPVDELPRPAYRHHARAGGPVFQGPVVPAASAPQSESVAVDGEGRHDDEPSLGD